METQGDQEGQEYLEGLLSVSSKLLARVVATRLRSWFDGHLGLYQFGFRRGRGGDDALQVARPLVEEVATSADGGKEWNCRSMTLRRRILGFVVGLCGIFCASGVAICRFFACYADVARWRFLQGSGPRWFF